jgi:hypothetical protein
MKAKILSTITLFCLAIGCGLAADPAPESVPSVAFRQSRVQVPKDGKMVETTNDVLVAGIAIVRTNGIFTVNKGKERQLLEGQQITSDGTLSSPDGSVVPIVDHLILKNGRLQVVKDGNPVPVTGDFALPDGSRVSADGSLRSRDGKLRRLLDGQLVKLDGSALPVTDTASLQRGKVVLYKDGSRIELRRGQTMAMSDGSKVSGDGFVIRADGSRVTLKEGELFRLEGATLRR